MTTLKPKKYGTTNIAIIERKKPQIIKPTKPQEKTLIDYFFLQKLLDLFSC